MFSERLQGILFSLCYLESFEDAGSIGPGE